MNTKTLFKRFALPLLLTSACSAAPGSAPDSIGPGGNSPSDNGTGDSQPETIPEGPGCAKPLANQGPARVSLTGTAGTISLMLPQGRTAGAKFYYAIGASGGVTKFGEGTFDASLHSTQIGWSDTCRNGLAGRLVGPSDGFAGSKSTYEGAMSNDSPPPPKSSPVTACPSGEAAAVAPSLWQSGAFLPTDIVTVTANTPIDVSTAAEASMGDTPVRTTAKLDGISYEPAGEAFPPGLKATVGAGVKSVMGESFGAGVEVVISAPSAYLLSLAEGQKAKDAVYALVGGAYATKTAVGIGDPKSSYGSGVAGIIGVGGTGGEATLKLSHRMVCSYGSDPKNTVWLVSADGLKTNVPVTCSETPVEAEVTIRGTAPYSIVVSARQQASLPCYLPGARPMSAYEITSASFTMKTNQ